MMYSRPLIRRRIVVTRALEQAGPMLEQLRALGAEAVSLPVIRLAPPSDPAPLAEARRALGDYDGVIFTSANGVRALLDGLPCIALSHRPWACAIGPATALALAERGWTPEFIAADARSEGVLAALAQVPLTGRRLLLPRAEQGRELIPDALRRRGAILAAVPTHRTEIALDAAPAARALFPGADAAILTSPSSARALATLLAPDEATWTGEGAGGAFTEQSGRALPPSESRPQPDPRVPQGACALGWEPREGARRRAAVPHFADRLARATLAVIGPVTSAEVERLGLHPSVEAAEASTEALVRALADHFSPGWDRA